MCNHFKFTHKVPNQTTPNQITPNRTTWSKNMPPIAKSLREISALLRYYTMLSDDSLPTIWENLSVPSSSVKKSKREKRAPLKII